MHRDMFCHAVKDEPWSHAGNSAEDLGLAATNHAGSLRLPTLQVCESNAIRHLVVQQMDSAL